MKGMETATLGRRLAGAIETLFPGYFALVMATGIVSIAAGLFDLGGIATGLLWINVAAYALLSLLLIVRCVAYFRCVMDDFRDHGRGPGFFTVVAGTCVLGAQLVVITEETAAAYVLWIVGIALWVLVMY
jgi:tellurite resistance protein TehA-like permease